MKYEHRLATLLLHGIAARGLWVVMYHRYALVVPALLAALIAYAISPLVTRFAIVIGAVDHPGARKVHCQPMPRLGGLAIIIAVGLVLILAPLVGGDAFAIAPVLVRGLLLGLLPIVAVSLVDDVRPVPARIKLMCHLLGAGLAVTAGVALPSYVHVLGHAFWIGPFAIPISVIWLAGITNAFNIIDGLDGLAAGLAIIACVAVSAVFVTGGQFSAAILPTALAGAIAGFLPYNRYPARIFLGDTGATAIGFALGVVALKGGVTMSAGFAAATPVLIMGLPIADTLVSIIRRLIHWGEYREGGVFQPDRNHVHHRLLALGLNHRTAVLLLYALGSLTALVAYVSLFVTHREAALLLLALLTAGAIGIKRLGYDEFAPVRRGTFLRFYETPVVRWSMFVVFVDIAFVCLSAYLAVALKTDDWLLQSQRALALRMAILLAPLSIAVFWKARLYEGSWRLASINDYVRAFLACGAVLVLALVLCAWQFQSLPASLLVVYGLVNAFLVVGSRASYRVLESAQQGVPEPAATPTLLYGPGLGDFRQARDLIERAASYGLRSVGFLTPTGAGRGHLLAGLKIWGSVDDMPMLTRSSGALAVIFAGPSAPAAAVRRFEELCRISNVVPYQISHELKAMREGDADAQRPSQSLLADIHRTRGDVAI